METSVVTAPPLVSMESRAEDDVFGQLSVSHVQLCLQRRLRTTSTDPLHSGHRLHLLKSLSLVVMWTTLTSNTNQNMSCVSIQGLHPSKNENSGEFTIYVTSSPRPCRAPRKVTRLWSQSRRILVFLSSHSALLGSISTAVCMFFITSLDPTFASWSAAPVAWQLWQYLGPLFFKWLYIWKVHPAAISFRVSIVVVFCKKQIQPSSVHNDSWDTVRSKGCSGWILQSTGNKGCIPQTHLKQDLKWDGLKCSLHRMQHLNWDILVQTKYSPSWQQRSLMAATPPAGQHVP